MKKNIYIRSILIHIKLLYIYFNLVLIMLCLLYTESPNFNSLWHFHITI